MAAPPPPQPEAAARCRPRWWVLPLVVAAAVFLVPTLGSGAILWEAHRRGLEVRGRNTYPDSQGWRLARHIRRIDYPAAKVLEQEWIYETPADEYRELHELFYAGRAVWLILGLAAGLAAQGLRWIVGYIIAVEIRRARGDFDF